MKLLLTLCASLGILCAQALAERPNIIFVMADDMGWGADRLSQASRAENAESRRDGGERTALRSLLCGRPVCSPTRATRAHRPFATNAPACSARLRAAAAGEDHRAGAEGRGLRHRRILANGISTAIKAPARRARPTTRATPAQFGFDEWVSVDELLRLRSVTRAARARSRSSRATPPRSSSPRR